MYVSSAYKLLQVLGLDRPVTPVKVVEPYQMLGKIDETLIEALGVDVVGLRDQEPFLGVKNEKMETMDLIF